MWKMKFAWVIVQAEYGADSEKLTNEFLSEKKLEIYVHTRVRIIKSSGA